MGARSGNDTLGESTGRLPEPGSSEGGNRGRGTGDAGCVGWHEGDGVISRAGFRNVLYVEPREVYLQGVSTINIYVVNSAYPSSYSEQ